MDKRLVWGIGGVLGGIALTLAATFLPKREIHHALSLNVFECQNVEHGARVCTAFGRLSIGNTGETECLAGLHVDHQRELGRLFNGHVGLARMPIQAASAQLRRRAWLA